MSRRKQENPQPRKRLVTNKYQTDCYVNCIAPSTPSIDKAEAAEVLLQDVLTCGSCQKDFSLSDIVKFIQHKVHSCNKENNYLVFGGVGGVGGHGEHDDYDDNNSDPGGGGGGGGGHGGGPPSSGAAAATVINSRRPSISAPMLRSRDRGPPERDKNSSAAAATVGMPRPSPSPSPCCNNNNNNNNNNVPCSSIGIGIGGDHHHHHGRPVNSNNVGASPSSAFGDDGGGGPSPLMNAHHVQSLLHVSPSLQHHHNQHHINANNNGSNNNNNNQHNHHHHHHHHSQSRRSSDADRDSPRRPRTPSSASSNKPKQVDAEANTTYTEPNNYVCSTCKHSFGSAWLLLQHVQNLHGMRIYVDGGGLGGGGGNCGGIGGLGGMGGCGPGTPMAPSPASSLGLDTSSLGGHHGSQPPTPHGQQQQQQQHPQQQQSNSHGGGGGGGGPHLTPPHQHQQQQHHQHQQHPPPPHPPLPPPPHLQLDHHHHHPFLLRLPLSERQFSPALNNPFIRPSSHDFRMELINNQFRLHSPAGLASVLPPFDHAHNPLFDHRPPPPPPPSSLLDRVGPPPPRFSGLPSLEPALDFYSKRLRELAGTTSPAPSPSPRKLTPPSFTSPQPPRSSSSQPSTPQPPHTPHTPTSSSSVTVPAGNKDAVVVSGSGCGGGGQQCVTPVPGSGRSAMTAADNTSPSSSSQKHGSSGGSGSLSGNGSKGGEKSCEFCGKTFRFQSNLIVHRRSHTGEKPYKCHICNHACTQASKLKRHMKTHQQKSPGSTMSNDTSVDSASSTPDSNGGGGGGGTKSNEHRRKYNNLRPELDGMDGGMDGEDNNVRGSVGDTPEDEDDDEEDDEEEEEEDELEEEEDEDELEEDELEEDEDDMVTLDGSEAAEDLSTTSMKSTSRLHGRHHRHHHHHHLHHGLNSLLAETNNRNGGGQDDSVSGPLTLSGGERKSLLGEVMEKIGLSNIQQYSEAYKQALEESNAAAAAAAAASRSGGHTIKQESRLLSEALEAGEHGNGGLIVENGLERALRLRDTLSKNILGQQPHLVDLPPTMLGAYDALLETSTTSSGKRIKLELDGGNGNGGVIASLNRERESLYAGLWLPAMATPRDIFMGMPGGGAEAADLLGRAKLSSESALKALGLPDTNSPKPGPSGGGGGIGGVLGLDGGHQQQHQRIGNHHHHHHHHHRHSSSAGSGNNGDGGGHMVPNLLGNGKVPKEQRRNDTCEYCGKVFKNCSNLTVHRRSHTGEKPYKCELCSYACAQSSKLTRHMKTHGRLGKDVYRCRFCEMPFSVPSTLEKHMRKCVTSQKAGKNAAAAAAAAAAAMAAGATMATMATSETDTDSKEATCSGHADI